MKAKRYHWWHGVAFYAGVQFGSWALKVAARKLSGQRGDASREEDRALYRSENLPAFAPPTAAFPIAWTINSTCAIAGGVHVLNLPERTPGRTEFLTSQAAAWTFYTIFQAAYFGLRSPIKAAMVTLLYTAATASSLRAAMKMGDRWAARSLATTTAWLALANPVGLTTAAWNRDPFWELGPLSDPPAGWTK